MRVDPPRRKPTLLSMARVAGTGRRQPHSGSNSPPQSFVQGLCCEHTHPVWLTLTEGWSADEPHLEQTPMALWWSAFAPALSLRRSTHTRVLDPLRCVHSQGPYVSGVAVPGPGQGFKAAVVGLVV